MRMNIQKDKIQQTQYWQGTTVPSLKNIKRNWFCFDLKKQIIGRMAVKIANILRGRHKNDFIYNLDIGDYVVLLNAQHLKFSGKSKLEQKQYYDHSGYIGGLRKRSAKKMLANYPKELVFRIIKGMIPHNKLGRKQLKRLFIFPEERHNLLAQQKNFINLS